MSEETEKKIIELIEEKKITPSPRGYFIAKNYFFWSVFSASLIVGAISLGTIIFLLSDYDWYLYKYLNMSPFTYVLISLPYLWIVSLILFLFISYHYFRTTKKGYRYDGYAVLGGMLSFALILGVIFCWAGMCEEIHDTLSKRVFLYNAFVFDRNDSWSNPEKGLLTGKVVKVTDNSIFMIEDSKGNRWDVKLDSALLPNGVVVSKGQTVRLIGKTKEGNIFLANMSRP